MNLGRILLQSYPEIDPSEDYLLDFLRYHRWQVMSVLTDNSVGSLPGHKLSCVFQHPDSNVWPCD